MSQCADFNSPEQAEISALEYARQNGIARNHLDDITTSFTNLCNLVRNGVESSVDGDPNLPRFSFGSAFRLEERMTLSKDATLLLSSIAGAGTKERVNATASSLLQCRVRRKLKLELPLLKSDHEVDCKEFSRRDSFEIQLKDIKLPFELVDDEKGEGLGWPTSLREYGPVLIQKLKKEKLQVKRNTVDFIRTTSASEWTLQDEKTLWASEQKHKTRAKEPITPILLPIELPPIIYEPSPNEEVYNLPILSDPLELVQHDLDAIEKDIFKQDVPNPIQRTTQREENSSDTYTGDRTICMKDVYSPLASLDRKSPPVVESERVKPQDLRVEPPLTPDLPPMSPYKAVRFSGLIMQLDYDPGSPSMKSDGLESRFFEDALHAHEKVTRQSEQEKLVYADAMLRVDVPKMDFTLPNPPWNLLPESKDSKALLEAQKKLIHNVIKNCGKEPVQLQGEGKVARLLIWDLPRHIVKDAIKLEFPGNPKSWQEYVRDLKDERVVDSSAVAWKPKTLMILKEEEDDEIDAAKFLTLPRADLSSLVKKRRLEEESVRAAQPHSNSRLGSEADSSKQFPGKKPRLESGTESTEANIGNLLGGRFSARNAVDNYMEMKGTKKPELSSSSFFAHKSDDPSDRQLAPSPRQLHSTFPIRKSPLPKPVTIPVPKFDIPLTPFYVIMSTSMYTKKSLIKTLERTLPSLVLIERDFTSQNTTAWLPGSVSRSPIVSPLASEADFIVSPSLGIIITTIKMVRQKSLPGHKAKSHIRRRVESVSARYENLLVLVSEESTSDTTNGMDSYDCEALAEFIGFKAGLDCNVIVQFVPGEDQVLSNWLMKAMIQYRTTEELLVEQTHWELFLRRAGMNAFAAQVILSQMKAPEGVDGSSPVKAGLFGLTGFVEMSKHERLARFGELCGRKLIKSVSDVIDAGW